MGAGRKVMAAMVVAAMWLWGAMAAAAQQTGQQVDCSEQFNAMQPCIEYINKNDAAPPSAPCCDAFRATELDTPVCLCQLQQAFADPASAPGNVTRANLIPSLCAVVVHPSRCPALLGIAPAAAPAAAATPAVAPTVAATPAVAPAAAATPAVAPTVAATPAVAPAAAATPALAPTVAAAPAVAPAAAIDCSPEFNSLATCIAYVSSNDTAPPADCCAALLNVHVKRPVCLCQLLQEVNTDPSQAAGGLNVTKALDLPAVCKVDTDASTCPALLGQPAASPLPAAATPGPAAVASPAAATPDAATPGAPAVLAPEASPAVTTTPTDSNGAATSAAALPATLFAALVAHQFVFFLF